MTHGIAPRLGQDAYEGTSADQHGAGLVLAAMAGLQVSLEKTAEHLRVQNERQRLLAQSIRVIPHIPIGQITAASTTLDQPELMSPRTGFAWEIRRITVATFTAGTVFAYIDGAVDTNQVVPFAVPGTTYPGSGNLIIQDGHRLVFQGNSLFTGTANISIGVIEVAQPWLAAYLL